MLDKIIGVAVAATLLLPAAVEIWIRRADGTRGLAYEYAVAVGLAVLGVFGITAVVLH